jgi:hypothetical protein
MVNSFLGLSDISSKRKKSIMAQNRGMEFADCVINMALKMGMEKNSLEMTPIIFYGRQIPILMLN